MEPLLLLANVDSGGNCHELESLTANWSYNATKKVVSVNIRFTAFFGSEDPTVKTTPNNAETEEEESSCVRC